MPSLLTLILIVSVATAWFYSLGLLILTIENRRFWRSHQKRPSPSMGRFPRALVVIPCKGMEHKLRENLTAFIQQDHPNFEICFVIESREDSAFRLIGNVMRENRHVKSSIVVAGRAVETGQKVHNLLEATARLSPEIEVLVFADSDAFPASSWLRWLVHGIGSNRVGARTGYRWMVPDNKSLATLLGCSLNNAIASLFGRGSHFLVWGGSWAIHRRVFDAVGIRQSWKGVVSDNLVASRSLQLSRLKINFEPRCVCTTNVRFTVTELFSYFRRQLIIFRKYKPAYWAIALSVHLLGQIGFWSGLVCGVSLIAAGHSTGWWLLASTSSLYLLSVLRGLVRQNMGRLVTHQWRSYRRARKFDIVAGPISGLFALFVILMSAYGHRLTWRGIKYDIGRGGRVLLIGRRIQTTIWPPKFGEAKSDDARQHQDDDSLPPAKRAA